MLLKIYYYYYVVNLLFCHKLFCSFYFPFFLCILICWLAAYVVINFQLCWGDVEGLHYLTGFVKPKDISPQLQVHQLVFTEPAFWNGPLTLDSPDFSTCWWSETVEKSKSNTKKFKSRVVYLTMYQTKKRYILHAGAERWCRYFRQKSTPLLDASSAYLHTFSRCEDTCLCYRVIKWCPLLFTHATSILTQPGHLMSQKPLGDKHHYVTPAEAGWGWRWSVGELRQIL